MPRVAAAGLFEGYSLHGDKSACEEIFSVVSFIKDDGLVDELTLRAALKIFDTDAGWRSVIDKGAREWRQGRLKGDSAINSAPTPCLEKKEADLSDLFMEYALAGKRKQVDILLEGDFYTLCKSSKTHQTPLEWAIKEGQARYCEKLGRRNEWSGLLKSRMRSKASREGSNQWRYGLESEFRIDFKSEGSWLKYPECMAALTCMIVLDEIDPDVLLSGYCLSPVSRKLIAIRN